MSSSFNGHGSDFEERFSPFEKMLGDRSFGPGPQNRGEVMYECGHAAGFTEARKQHGRATRRWRVTGLAASVIACASIVMQIRSFESNSPDQPAAERPVNTDSAEVAMPIQMPASDDWLVQLTTKSHSDDQNQNALRASSSIEILNVLNEPESDLTPAAPCDQEPTLQPRDFQKFL